MANFVLVTVIGRIVTGRAAFCFRRLDLRVSDDDDDDGKVVESERCQDSSRRSITLFSSPYAYPMASSIGYFLSSPHGFQSAGRIV